MQRQQSKKAPKVQSQRAKPRKQSKKAHVTSQGSHSQMKYNNVPAAFAVTTVNPTWLSMSGKVNHPELGGGVRITGRQEMNPVITTATDSQLFGAGTASTNSINAIYLSPDTLNGRLALQARTYDRYVFRKVRLWYLPRVPTTQPGSFALGYVNDSKFPAPTFSNISSMCPSMNATFYGEPRYVDLVDDMNTQKTYFCLLDVTSEASLRQTVQGVILGAPDVTSIGAVTMGRIWIEYMIDLYQPTIDQGFTLRLTKEEEEKILSSRKEKESLSSAADTCTEISLLQARIQQLKYGNQNL